MTGDVALDPFFVHDGVALLAMEEDRYLSAVSVENVRNRQWMEYAAASLFPTPRRRMPAFLAGHGGRAVAFTVHDLGAEGRHVGNAYLMSLDFVHRTGETSMLIFREFRGQRFDVRTGLLLLKYGFLRLALRRIWAGSANPAALATNYGMGMTPETRLRRAALVGAGVRDTTQFAILREDFLRKFGGLWGAADA